MAFHEMPDVDSLVGVDAGVLDQNLAAHVGGTFALVTRDLSLCSAHEPAPSRLNIQPCIDVPQTPATSSFSKPSGNFISAAISSAILRGGLRRRLASSNDSGSANSPSSTDGGFTDHTFDNSIWYFSRTNARTALASCF